MSNTLKPYLVELVYTAVVMAPTELDAEIFAELNSNRIVGDSCYASTNATEVRSLAHLNRLDSGWSAGCCAYGGDEPTLGQILPEEDQPERDTKTADLFSSQQDAA